MAVVEDLNNEIAEVNAAHKVLMTKISALVKKAGGDRRAVYQTTMSDGGEVKLAREVEPLFKGARLFRDRWRLTEYCAALLKGEHGTIDCIAEIGVESGVYASFMADTFHPKKMLLVDTKPAQFRSENQRPGMEWFEGYSGQMIPQFADRSVLYAYVDGAHDYAIVSDDIEKILPKMKPGGIVQFNDYATFNLRFAQPYGVKAAVNRLINSRRVSVVGHGLCPMGFDDVAVRVITPEELMETLI